MPFYPYKCPSCTGTFEVVKDIDLFDRSETCPACGSQVTRENRVITPFSFYGADDWNKQTFNHGLGCYTKSDAQARKIAKSRGLEEVGNEPLESMEKAAAKIRAEKETKRWNDVEEGVRKEVVQIEGKY